MEELAAAEREWVRASTDPGAAAACARLAAAFNRLDGDLLAGLLAPGCLYQSQSVVEVLRGREAVARHFAEKFRLLREAGDEHLVTAELAVEPGGAPCVLLRQRDSGYGRPGLGRIVSFLRPLDTRDGLVGRLFMVTTVPAPDSARGAGIHPGRDAEELRRAREHQGPRIPLTPEVGALFFSMRRMVISEQMRREVRELMRDFAPARLREFGAGDRDACAEHGVQAFPTLIITRGAETVATVEGYRAPRQLRELLESLLER